MSTGNRKASQKNHEYKFFSSYDWSCSPCSMNYHFVTKQESSAADASFILRQRNLTDITYLPGMESFVANILNPPAFENLFHFLQELMTITPKLRPKKSSMHTGSATRLPFNFTLFTTLTSLCIITRLMSSWNKNCTFHCQQKSSKIRREKSSSVFQFLLWSCL